MVVHLPYTTRPHFTAEPMTTFPGRRALPQLPPFLRHIGSESSGVWQFILLAVDARSVSSIHGMGLKLPPNGAWGLGSYWFVCLRSQATPIQPPVEAA